MSTPPKPRVHKERGGMFEGWWVVEHGIFVDPHRTWAGAIDSALAICGARSVIPR